LVYEVLEEWKSALEHYQKYLAMETLGTEGDFVKKLEGRIKKIQSLIYYEESNDL
jgi:hypothetical protein